MDGLNLTAEEMAYFEAELRKDRIRKLMSKEAACAFVEAIFSEGDYWNLRLTTFPPRATVRATTSPSLSAVSSTASWVWPP